MKKTQQPDDNDKYYQYTGKTEQEIETAQDVLVDSSIKNGLGMMYKFCLEECHSVPSPTIRISEEKNKDENKTYHVTEIILKNDNNNVCNNAEETFAAIKKMFPDNEFQRVAAFNQIAKCNKFDLSLKSSGHKEFDSIKEKIDARRTLKDILRVTVISRRQDLLDKFADNIQGNDLEQEDWQMTKNAVMKRTTTFEQDGLNAEVQFVPREQAHAMRISHVLYEIKRGYDCYEKIQFKNSPIAVEKKEQIIEKYNTIANLFNDILAEKILEHDYYQTFNKLLANDDMSKFTLDEEGESLLHKKVKKDGHPEYSPIIKNQGELSEYRKNLRKIYLKVFQNVNDDGKLPILEKNVDDETFQKSVQKISDISRATHACYMQGGMFSMRKHWLKKGAMTLNKQEKNTIPQIIIDAVAEGVPEKGTSIDVKELEKELETELRAKDQNGKV